MLARYTANDAETMALTVAFAAFALDAREALKHSTWRHVYLGRYMRISPSELEKMPLSQIRRYVATLSELIKKEAGPSQMAETNFI